MSRNKISNRDLESMMSLLGLNFRYIYFVCVCVCVYAHAWVYMS